jgi:glucose-6-phosphate isomerase
MAKARDLAALLSRRIGTPPAPPSLQSPVTLEACGIRIDISGQRIGADDLSWLRELAASVDFLAAFRSMVEGDLVNPSEQRAALHTALRAHRED